MSELPFDVMTYILKRLPVESLLRFRCLSKSICSLIDSPYFVKLHLDHSTSTNSNFILVVDDLKPKGSIFAVDLEGGFDKNPVVALDRPFESKPNAFRYSPYSGVQFMKICADVFGSCNGLIALFCIYSGIALWNPWTKRYIFLPEFPSGWRGRDRRSFRGFGFDSRRNDYKVVIFVETYSESSFTVAVYSLKENSWKEICGCRFYASVEDGEYGVLVGCSLHWLVYEMEDDDSGDDERLCRYQILALDLTSDEVNEIPLPVWDKYPDEITLGVLGGKLCVCCGLIGANVDLWIMKEYGVRESWTLLSSFYTNASRVRPLCYSSVGDVVLLELNGIDLSWHNLKNNELECSQMRGEFLRTRIRTQVCVKTLMPLNSDAKVAHRMNGHL